MPLYEVDMKIKILVKALESGPHMEPQLIAQKAAKCMAHASVKVLDVQITRIMEDGKNAYRTKAKN